MASPSTDPFDTLLTLEDTLYTTAHSLGSAAGSHQGRLEGRLLGLERGFELFQKLGALHGRGAVWGARIAVPSSTTSTTTSTSTTSTSTTSTSTAGDSKTTRLPPLAKPTRRLTSNTTLLYHLTDPLTFSTDNSPAGVEDYLDRVKRAGAKERVVERIVGESEVGGTEETGAGEKGKGGKGTGDGSMEDFGARGV